MDQEVVASQAIELDFGPRGPASLVANDPDPLKEARDLKRWVQIGVYAAIFLVAPFYYFLLGFSAIQLLTVFLLGLALATAAIEMAFKRVLRLRKRSTYPGLIIVELGGIDSHATACRRALDIPIRLLRLRAAFLALKSDQAAVSLVALADLDRLEAERLLQMGMMNIQQALRSALPVRFQPAHPLLAEAMLDEKELLIFVPVIALEKPIGVLAALGPRDNPDLKDLVLLRGIGVALGLSLENLRQREELREMAAIDELTRVYNRRYFFEQLEREVAAARRYNSCLALLVVDLDGLKGINDQFGHLAGDEALRTVGQRLVRHSRAADLVARLGGDEFAMILPRSSRQGAQEMASRLCQAIAVQPFLLPDGTSVPLAVSCGVAAFPEDAQDIEELLREADANMYGAKPGHRGQGEVKAQ